MSYSQAPPTYTGPKTHSGGYQAISQEDNPGSSSQPLLHDAPREEGDIDPDDFKFGVTVEQSSPEIRQMFLKKVYSVLFIQLLATTVMAGIFSTPTVTTWVRQNTWSYIISMIASIVTMGFLFFKRHSHPLNFVLLGLFTTFEAFSLGLIVSYVSQTVVLQALIITLFTFLGLTLFTFQSRYDFSKMGPWLFGGLLFLVGAGFVQIFLPFSQAIDIAFAAGGCLIFSGYIIYDTHMILKRLSPEEWVLAVVSLYLDILNLFISVLRILNGTSNDN
ncbi:glutamate binding protein [Meira miltonrushii]|uniref:Glutamate binding protein n=1 Tax=Meira miltonrushii TaxID=1280837 RepID=A0A316V2N3_9BASI|nr:glutamate binding protein [Meira miltonrushii]PWN31258.1 glutamate binding protein [Meira miltonrushii]